jgi:hypothetical protein
MLRIPAIDLSSFGSVELPFVVRADYAMSDTYHKRGL